MATNVFIIISTLIIQFFFSAISKGNLNVSKQRLESRYILYNMDQRSQYRLIIGLPRITDVHISKSEKSLWSRLGGGYYPDTSNEWGHLHRNAVFVSSCAYISPFLLLLVPLSPGSSIRSSEFRVCCRTAPWQLKAGNKKKPSRWRTRSFCLIHPFLSFQTPELLSPRME